MDASDDFIPAHPPHAWSDEHVTRGETRCVSLTLSDEMMEVARRVASKAALALDALHALAATDMPSPPPPQSTQKA